MHDETTPTGVLRNEHQLILRVAAVLESIVGTRERGAAIDFESLEDCITFIRLYADACHHGKEEDLLFVELESFGLQRDSGPIAVMLFEHEQGRALVREMTAHFDPAKAGEPESLVRLQRAALEYVELIRMHILKEDNMLFAMADTTLQGPACRQLCDAYGVVCQRKFEGCTKAQLETLAEELEARYPQPLTQLG